jgi:hypothetical protein
MSIDDNRRTCGLSAALAEAARVAGFAPSLHNTQPWRWRVDGPTLELYADPIRQLTVSDPGGRLMVLSCGAALHHARIALAAQGLPVVVERLAGIYRPRLLARLTVSDHSTADPGAIRLLQTIQIRHADGWPMTDAIVDRSRIDTVRAAVEAEHSSLRILTPDDLLDLSVVADRALGLAEFDPQRLPETSYRAGDIRADRLGVPDPVSPDGARTTGCGPDPGSTGELTRCAQNDCGPVYAILFGSGDTPAAWLYAGEALSAGWLTATELGVRVVPLIAAGNGDGTRQVLRRLLPPLSTPFLVLRFGTVDPIHPGPHKPRPSAAQVVAPSTVGNGHAAGPAADIKPRPLAAVPTARRSTTRLGSSFTTRSIHECSGHPTVMRSSPNFATVSTSPPGAYT